MRLNLALFVVGLVSLAFALPLNTTQPEAQVSVIDPKQPASTSDHMDPNAATPPNDIVPSNHAIQLRATVTIEIPISINRLMTNIIDECLQSFLDSRQFRHVQFSINHITSSSAHRNSYRFKFSHAERIYEGTMILVQRAIGWVVDSSSSITQAGGPHL